MKMDDDGSQGGLKFQLNKLLFCVDSGPGRWLNIFVLLLIVVAVFASMLNTLPDIRAEFGEAIDSFQKYVLYAFALEYFLRVLSARQATGYIKSFNGIIDLITILPLFFGANSHVIIRLLRAIRIIRIALYFPVVRALFASLQGSIQVLLGVLGTIALISVTMGNLVFILEPETFADAFEGTWWSLVTMSTVGYGDFVPHTPVGRLIAAGLIMSGICMFAMVTAVVSVRVGRMVHNSVRCSSCSHAISPDYDFCPHCTFPQDAKEAAAGLDEDGLEDRLENRMRSTLKHGL